MTDQNQPTTSAKRGRKPKSPSDTPDARSQIIAAAEQLFAAGGINGASLREIATAAGQGNHFAVQYHFGSREGLVQAIFEHRMLQMEARRTRMLADAEVTNRLGDVRTLLEIIYLPQLDLQGGDGRHSYAGFLSQYLLRTRSQRFGVFSPATPPSLARTLALLRDRVAHLPEAIAQRRLVSCSLMFVHILIHHSNDEWDDNTGENFQSAMDDTLDQIELCMSAPLRTG